MTLEARDLVSRLNRESGIAEENKEAAAVVNRVRHNTGVCRHQVQ